MVVSLGTGRLPVKAVDVYDVYRPEGVVDIAKVVFGAKNLAELFVDQVCDVLQLGVFVIAMLSVTALSDINLECYPVRPVPCGYICPNVDLLALANQHLAGKLLWKCRFWYFWFVLHKGVPRRQPHRRQA